MALPGGRARPPADRPFGEPVEPTESARGEAEVAGPPRTRWRRIVGVAIAAAAIFFAIGYLLAVFVLFPAPEPPPAGIAVPKLIGQDRAWAAQALAKSQLRLGEATEQPDPTAAAGTIVAQDPLPGQQLRAGAAVRIAVSSGPAEAVLPDLTGTSAARATAMLQSLGFRVAQQTEQAPMPAGTVARIEPSPGVPYLLPQDVRLVVSSGPPPPPPDTLPPADSTGLAPQAVPAQPAAPAAPPAVPAPRPDTIP